jgi:hypothetical protein
VPGNPLYDDGGLLLDQDGATIRRYYFPWAGAKRIDWSEIRGVEVRHMRWLTGKGRGWGSAHPRYWLPLDLSRPRKDTLLVLDVGHRVMPALTPDDADRVVELIRARTDKRES